MLGFVVIPRHRKQMLGEGRRFELFESPQAFIFIGGNNDDGRLTMLSDGLWRPAGGLHDGAEAVFGVLNGPGFLRHRVFIF